MKFALAERKEIAAGTVEVAFDIRGREFHFQAGQYIWITLPRLFYDDERGGSRCFSIASSPNDTKFLSIAFRTSDSGYKRTFAEMAIGSEVEIEGPLGDMLLPEDIASPIVCVAGGIGITPFLSMLRFATEQKKPYRITLLYVNRNPESVVYREELEELVRQNANLVVRDMFGLVDAKTIKKNIDGDAIKTARWYVVGPPAMAMETEKILYEFGVKRENVRLTEFVGYAVPADAKEPSALPGFAEAILRALDKNVLVSATDLQGAIIYANDKFVEVSRYNREEIIGQNHSILKSGAHSEKFYQELWHTISTGRVWRGEIKNRAKDGSFYWVDAIIAQITKEDNKPLGYIAVRFLITEQKKLEEEMVRKNKELTDIRTAILNVAEDVEEEKKKVEIEIQSRTRELREEQARLLASINSLSFGFVIADTDDNVIVKNTAISTILELTEEPASVQDIVNSFKGVASELDVLTRSCRECIDLKKDVELKEISHGKKYLRVFCTPVITKDESAPDSSENVIGYVILVEDVTEAKIMERSRDEFFAVASHELRTPLTAIRGNADMILDMFADKIVDKDMKEMLQDIDVSSIRLIGIVNDFLEVSRLEQGRVEIKKENFNVSDVIEKVIFDLTTMIKQKGLSIAYTPPSSPLPAVFADKNRTEQVLLNLVGNAIKFTKEGGITVTASAVGGFVGIRVTDTGLGISEHNQSLLFRKFQPAGEQMLARDVTQSTGLGLYISKLIISSMGGTIELEASELGKGSTFIFTLPVAANNI
jgi:PAS domain S-box-containing protein